MKNRYIFCLLSLSIIYWRFFVNFPSVSTDLHNTFQVELIDQFSLPQAWSDAGAIGLGDYAVSVLWAWPIHFLFGLFGKFGFSHALLIKTLGILPVFVFGALGIDKLLENYQISPKSRLLGQFFYLANTYIILLIDGGQLNLAVAYALLPLAFFYYEKAAFENKNMRQSILLFSLSSLALSIFDIRIICFLLMLIFVRFIVERKNIFRHIYIGFIVGVVLVCFHAYWILPSFFVKAPALPVTYDRVSQTSFLSFAELKHSISLLQPHWYQNIFGKIPPFNKMFLIMPLFVFLIPALKRNKRITFWLIIAIIGVFLAKGTNVPFPDVYPWLFTTVPGFSLFRDPVKFYFLIALSYTILIAFTSDYLTKKYKSAYIILFIIVFSLVSPAWLGKLKGTLSFPLYKSEYYQVADEIKNDKEFGRIFWIPTKSSLGYSSPNHLSIEAARVSQLRPFAVGTVGRYEQFNYLRESIYMGKLFDVFGMRYLAYPYPSNRDNNLSQDEIDYYYGFNKQIGELGWIDKKIYNFPINVYQTENNQDHIFVTNNLIYVVGSDRIYREDIDLSENSLVFVEENTGLFENIPNHAKIILYDKNDIDLILLLASKQDYIFPAKNLDFEPNKNDSGWWKREAADVVWWRDFLQQKYMLDNQDFDYQGGWAIAEGSKTLQIKNTELQKENKLFARVMFSNRSGKIIFKQNDQIIGEITTKIDKPKLITQKLTGNVNIEDQYFEYGDAPVQWVEVGNLVDNNNIEIDTEGELNVINALVSISASEFSQVSIASINLLKNKLVQIKDISDLENGKNKPEIFYKRNSPTDYIVEVTNITKPTTLVFSEKYDQLWELNGQSPYPVYSGLNGFTVNTDGEYRLYYSAQKYVEYGLYITCVTVFGIILYIMKYEFRKRQKTSKN